MGILSPTASVTRYKVDGKIEGSTIETVYNGLKKNVIGEIDGNPVDHTVGWTSFETPYRPNFKGSSFLLGSYFVFALRIDKKSIPPKVVQKYFTKAANQRMNETDRYYLSANEKRILKDQVIDSLCLRIPSTPNVYDLIWNYEAASLWLFTNTKAANEELQTLFIESFNLNLTRLFPYTMATLMAGLSHLEMDALAKLKPTQFTE